MLCLCLDMACALVDWTSLQAEFSQTRVIIATGVILFVFTFERIVRTYGYGSTLIVRPFERPIEILDNIIILASIVIYCMVLYSDLEQLSKSILTISRVVRLLRLIKVSAQPVASLRPPCPRRIGSIHVRQRTSHAHSHVPTHTSMHTTYRETDAATAAQTPLIQASEPTVSQNVHAAHEPRALPAAWPSPRWVIMVSLRTASS